MVQPQKKKTLIQNITYMGLMAAINVVFVLLTAFVPILFFLIVFVLPLTSTIVTIHCKKRYYPIYAFATIGLCLICTIWKIDDTIFYVIPSIISGFLFGFLIEKKIPSFWIIIATTITQIAFSYCSIPIIEALTGRNIINDFATAFGIQEFKYLNYVTPCFIFFLSLSQEIISYMVIKEELPKFGIKLEDPKYLPLSLFIALASTTILAFIFAFIKYCGPISYLFTLFALLLACYSLFYLLAEKNYTIYIMLAGGFIISFFSFAALYPLFNEPLGLILINIFFFIEAIIVLINNYLLKRKKKDTIEIV